MTSEGRQLCSPSEQMNGGRPRRHLSSGGDLRLSGGHLIALSHWPEIKNVLLCLWFCHDLKPWPGGEQFTSRQPVKNDADEAATVPEFQSGWMEMFYSLALMLTTSAHGKLSNRTFSLSLFCGLQLHVAVIPRLRGKPNNTEIPTNETYGS